MLSFVASIRNRVPRLGFEVCVREYFSDVRVMIGARRTCCWESIPSRKRLNVWDFASSYLICAPASIIAIASSSDPWGIRVPSRKANRRFVSKSCTISLFRLLLPRNIGRNIPLDLKTKTRALPYNQCCSCGAFVSDKTIQIGTDRPPFSGEARYRLQEKYLGNNKYNPV
jgi:hypothetical protein